MVKALLFTTIGCFAASMNVTTEETSEPAPVVAVVEQEAEKDGWDLFVEQYLNADKVAMYFSWVAYIGTIIGLVANIKKLTKQKNLTIDNLIKAIKDQVSPAVAEEMKKYLPAVLSTQGKTNEILVIFSKILALSQQGDAPENRLAVLDLVGQLGIVSQEIINNAKLAVEEQVHEEQAHEEELNEKLDEVIDKYDGTSI